MRRSSLLAPALVLVLSGCGSLLGVPVRPDAPDEAPAPAPEPSGETVNGMGPADLAAARAQWRVADLDAYRYTLSRSCFCPEDVRGPFRVRVRDGRLLTVTRGGQPAGPNAQVPTVEALFDLLAQAYADGADEVRVRYDARLGYPVEVWINPETQAADEETGYTVAGLEAE